MSTAYYRLKKHRQLQQSAEIEAEVSRSITETLDVELENSDLNLEVGMKLNFLETNTYKYLLEVLTNKFPEVREKEFSSVLSRWFSGAKDREGGKKERMARKTISNII